MKKYSFIVLVVLAALMAAACSRSKLSPEADENAWMYDETLPVPIKIGGSDLFGIQTKSFEGKIESFAGLAEPLPIRVCAIDLGIGVPDSSAASDISDYLTSVGWNETLGYCTEITTCDISDASKNKLFLNEKAQITTAGEIQFLGSNSTVVNKYYPYSETQKVTVGNEEKTKSTSKNYSFIAYYSPSATGAPYADDSGNLYKNFSLLPSSDYESNNLDVLWARVDAKPGQLPKATEWNGFYQGFNARYIREVRKEDAGYKPNLHFQHVTSCIHIYVQAEDAAAVTSWDGDNNDNSVGDVTVKNMQIAPKIPHVKMNLLTGELTLNEDRGKVNNAYNYYPTSVIHPVTAPQEYAEGFFVMPGARVVDNVTPANDERIRVTFDIEIEGQDPLPQSVALPLPTYNDGTQDIQGYQAGVEYNYYINIKALVGIQITGTVTTWDTTTGASQLGQQTIDFE